MITVTKSGYCLRIEGHAGYAEHGRDIVCASVSSLFCTLSGGVEAHEELFESPPAVYTRAGVGVLECVPREECRDMVDLLFDVMMSGIYSIALQYPGHVKVFVK